MARRSRNTPVENFAVMASISIIFLVPIFYIEMELYKIIYLGLLVLITAVLVFNPWARKLFLKKATFLLIILVIVIIITVIVGSLYYMMSNLKENQG